MYVAFEDLPDDARVWIYQSDRKIRPNELDWMDNVARSFCEQWAAHGHDLRSSFKVFHEQFLVLAVDEKANLPSGCSIDSSVHLVNQVQDQLGINFFDRLKVAFLNEEGVFLEPLASVKEKISSGEISQALNTFNNLVGTKGELEEGWKIPAGESWLKKYFA